MGILNADPHGIGILANAPSCPTKSIITSTKSKGCEA